MNLIKLQETLATVLESVTDESMTPEEHAKAISNAEATARLAKQMINNADVILRADKLSDRHDRIDQIVG